MVTDSEDTAALAWAAVHGTATVTEISQLARRLARTAELELVGLFSAYGDGEDQSWREFRERMLPAMVIALVQAGGSSERVVRAVVVDVLGSAARREASGGSQEIPQRYPSDDEIIEEPCTECRALEGEHCSALDTGSLMTEPGRFHKARKLAVSGGQVR
jgi:hypothetical protein